MAYAAQKKTAAAVLSWYDNQDLAGYIVYTDYKTNPNKIYYVYRGTNKEEGADALNRILSEIEPTDNNTYFIQTQSPGKKPVAGCGCTFSLYQAQNGFNPSYYGANNEVISKLNGISARLDALETDDEENDDDEPETTPNSILAGLVNNPQIQNVMVNFLTSLAGNLMKPAAPGPVQQLAGVDDNQILQTAINELMLKGVTISDLQKLAAMDQGQINFLLSMLRK